MQQCSNIYRENKAAVTWWKENHVAVAFAFYGAGGATYFLRNATYNMGYCLKRHCFIYFV